MSKKRKIGIIGAGHVGGHAGYALAMSGIVDEIVYIDTDKAKARAQSIDIEDASGLMSHRIRLYAGDYEDLRNCDLIIVSAGPLPKDKTQTRMDTLFDTLKEIKDIAASLQKINYDGIIINISNPADVVTGTFYRLLGKSPRKYISTSTILDSARLKRVLSRELGVDPKSITAYVLGEHGESQMVAFSQINIGGLSLEEYEKKNGIILDREDVANKARLGGWDVFLGKGCTEYGIGSSILELVRAILGDEKKILPVSVYIDGEYDNKDVFVSLPCIVGENGVEKIIELDLSEDERLALSSSIKELKKGETEAKKWLGI